MYIPARTNSNMPLFRGRLLRYLDIMESSSTASPCSVKLIQINRTPALILLCNMICSNVYVKDDVITCNIQITRSWIKEIKKGEREGHK